MRLRLRICHCPVAARCVAASALSGAGCRCPQRHCGVRAFAGPAAPARRPQGADSAHPAPIGSGTPAAAHGCCRPARSAGCRPRLGRGVSVHRGVERFWQRVRHARCLRGSNGHNSNHQLFRQCPTCHCRHGRCVGGLHWRLLGAGAPLRANSPARCRLAHRLACLLRRRARPRPCSRSMECVYDARCLVCPAPGAQLAAPRQ